jgi:monofunctional biosynthetic peptidoglycan transglycosylase
MRFLSRRRRAASTRPSRRLWRWLALALLLAIVIDAAWLAWRWPDWDRLASGPAPKSAFITAYEQRRQADRRLPPLRWQPVPFTRIAPAMRRAVIVAEDSRFYLHEGVDFEALMEAMEHNWEQGRITHGASTISQQTVKNLFLSPSRDPLRKWHELVLTWAMERNLKKRRILELYLNVAEFGPGIYGVEAAARRYWGISAAGLSLEQAVELAATLPSPAQNNPATRSRAFQQRKAKIMRHLVPRTTLSAVEVQQPGPQQQAVDHEGQHADALQQPEKDVDAQVGGETGQHAAEQ